MGNYDYNNYLVIVKVRDNITDPAYMKYCVDTDMGFSIKEYLSFEKSHPSSTHPTVVKALKFICSYSGGIMRPDKWGYGEPLKRVFNEDTVHLLISYLTRPGGQESIRKNRFYLADFENEMHVPIWEGKKPIKISERERSLPDYMFTMTFYFSKSLKNILPFIKGFVKEFCKELSTDYGIIVDQLTMETIFDMSNPQ